VCGALACALAGCAPSLGECDEAAALEIVYDPAGAPAFAGQALMIRGCGGGAFCHSEDIPLADRFGAPLELDFDLRLASTGPDPNIAAVDRLARHQVATVRERGLIWEQVHLGSMPPPGTTAPGGVAEPTQTYQRVGVDGVSFAPLPDLDEEEGREILQNWLACGAPVIERSEPREDRVPSNVGFEVAACERDCVDLTWPSLYADTIAPSCATASCHDAQDPSAALDLSGGPDATHARILDAAAAGDACVDVGMPMLSAGDPAMSLLVTKVTPNEIPCGSEMPLAGNSLSAQRRCALEAWVACGACPETDGGACRECIESRRADCGVMLEGGEPVCVEQAPCEGFAPPP